MKIKNSLLFRDPAFQKRIIFIGLASLFIIIGSIIQYQYQPAKWMTYRDFDVPGIPNFINYLAPGVKDCSTNTQYQFDEKHYFLLFTVLFFFFPLMLFLRIVMDFDFKSGLYRYLTQWLTFVVARLGIFRVTGICPVKRTGLGVFPFMNCQSCELATGACPLGTFQMSLLNQQIPVILIGQIILVGIISGRWLCGWLCPFGFLSDIFDKIPGKRIKLPVKISSIKYLVLLFFVFSSISYFFKDQSKVLLYCAYLCPVGFYYGVLEYALTTGLKSLIADLPFIHFMLIYHFLIAALFIIGSIKLGARFFCKYACPMGTLYGLFARISIINLKLNSNRCNGCQACQKVCPMKISILDQSFVSKSNCILCGRCKKVCPTQKIEYTWQLFNSIKPIQSKPIKSKNKNQVRKSAVNNGVKSKISPGKNKKPASPVAKHH